MWIKDGVVSPGWIILNVAPEGEEEKLMKCVNPTPEQYRENGWTWQEPQPPEPAPPAPKRYSKLKIIRALGDGWAAKKAQLEAAGVLDEFMAAQFMAEDDPAFGAVYSHLTDEEKRILDEECLYDE